MTLDEFNLIISTSWDEKTKLWTIDMTEDNYQRSYQLGLNSLFLPH